MEKLTVRKEIMISEIQAESLKKLKSYGVNVNQFIRQAVKDKIKRDWPEIREKKKKEYCPF